MTTRIVVTRYAVSLAGLCLAATLAACSSNPAAPSAPSPSGGGGGGGSTEPTFANVQAQILTPVCTACHTANGLAPAGGMNLTSAVAYANLVNVASSAKPGAVRVIPGDAANSYLIQKLQGASGIFGSRMPLGGPYLSDAQVALIQAWIAAGAPNN